MYLDIKTDSNVVKISDVMTPAEFVKFAAEHHIKISIKESNEKYPYQICQDDEINHKFRELHVNIVNMIADFCKTYNIIVDKVNMDIDDFSESCKHGKWVSDTDSCFSFKKFSEEYKKTYLFST